MPKTTPYNFIALLITLTAFGLRVHRLGAYSLWYDELLQVDIAAGPLAAIWDQLPRHAAMPLDYYLMAFWLQGGEAEFWVRWPAVIFGTLAIPLIYGLASRFFQSRRVGLMAAALLAISSFALDYSQEARPYALLMLLVLIGVGGVWQAYHTRQSLYWIVAALGLIGAIFTHYFALFLLLPLGLYVAAWQLTHWRDSRIWEQTAFFALSLLLLAVLLLASGRILRLYSVGYGFAQVVEEPTRLTQEADEKPNRGSGPPIEREFFINGMVTPLSAGTREAMLLFNAFFLIALLSLLRRDAPHQATVLLLLGWLILPIALIYLFLLQRGTFYAVRYIFYTLPAYLMLVAYGLDLTARWLSRRQYQPLALMLLLSLPLFWAKFDELRYYYAEDSREDWRAVGALLKAHAEADDLVIAVHAEPTMNWYYPAAHAPFGTYDTVDAMWQEMQQHPRRWFVLSSYSRSRDETLRDWLRENGGVPIGVDRRVVVYLQERGRSAESLVREIETFSLPQKPLTYVTLANQLYRLGDIEASQRYYQRALELTPPAEQSDIAARMAPAAQNFDRR